MISVKRLGTIFTTAILAPTIIGSCKFDSRAPSTVVFILVDRSGSANNPHTDQIYTKFFRGDQGKVYGGILGEIKDDTLLMGDVITENTIKTATYPLNVTFPKYSIWMTGKLKQKREIHAARRNAEQQFRTLLALPPAPKTDLMNAFQLADQIFNGRKYKSAKYKVLVVFSDMIEQSDSYDFTAERLTDKKIEEIITSERKAGRLPNLRGVDVWCAGATSSSVPGVGVDSRKIREIRKFWLAYFKSAGADLGTDRYSPALVNFALPPD